MLKLSICSIFLVTLYGQFLYNTITYRIAHLIYVQKDLYTCWYVNCTIVLWHIQITISPKSIENNISGGECKRVLSASSFNRTQSLFTFTPWNRPNKLFYKLDSCHCFALCNFHGYFSRLSLIPFSAPSNEPDWLDLPHTLIPTDKQMLAHVRVS